MKKILILIISSFLFISLDVKALELPTFEVGNSTGYNGEIVTIPITIKNNPGFGYLGVKIRYSQEKLEYIEGKTIGLKNAYMKGIEQNKKKTITLYAISESDYKLINDNGKIAEMTFRIKGKNSENIPISVQIDNFGKGDNEEIDINSIIGSVKVINHGVIGTKENLSKEIKNKGENKIKWTTSNNKVATVNNEGKVTFKKEGKVSIKAQDKEGNILFSEDYKVDNKAKEKEIKNNINYIIYTIPILVICCLIVLYFKKKSKK